MTARKSNKERKGGTPPRLDRKEVFSYHSNRSAATPEPRRTPGFETITSKRWHHVPFLLTAGLFVVVLLNNLMVSTSVRVIVPTMQTPSSPLLQPTKVYQDAAEKQLKSSVFNRTKLTIDTSQFDQDMQKQFPDLSNVSIALPLMGHRPIVSLTPVKPALIMTNSQTAVVIDETGRAVAKVGDVASSLTQSLPKLSDESNVPIELGKGTITQQSVTFITTFIQELKVKSITVSSLSLPSRANELLVKVNGSNYVIKCSLITDPRIAAGQYLAVRHKLEQDHVTPAEYVDVRVEEKVFYK